MNPITALLTGGFSNILSGISGILDHFIANPEEKLKAQLELSKMANDYQMAVLAADKDFAVQQASVITAEAKSESWLARNWRPLLMLTFTYIIAHNYIIAPVFGIQSVRIPPDMWTLLKIGMGGYIAGRTIEKTTPDVVAAIKASKT